MEFHWPFLFICICHALNFCTEHLRITVLITKFQTIARKDLGPIQPLRFDELALMVVLSTHAYEISLSPYHKGHSNDISNDTITVTLDLFNMSDP